jgi:hypothetical protein
MSNLKTYPAPKILAVCPTFNHAEDKTFSLYWIDKHYNLGVPVVNQFTKPAYASVTEAIAAAEGWGCEKLPVVRDVPLDAILVRISK